MHVTEYFTGMFTKVIVLLEYFDLFYDMQIQEVKILSHTPKLYLLCWHICLMLLGTYYAKNYAGIISRPRPTYSTNLRQSQGRVFTTRITWTHVTETAAIAWFCLHIRSPIKTFMFTYQNFSVIDNIFFSHNHDYRKISRNQCCSYSDTRYAYIILKSSLIHGFTE